MELQPAWTTILSSFIVILPTAVLAIYAGLQHRREDDRKKRAEAPHVLCYEHREFFDSSTLSLMNLSREAVFVSGAASTWSSLVHLFEEPDSESFIRQIYLPPGGRVNVMHWGEKHPPEPPVHELRVEFFYALTGHELHAEHWRLRDSEDGKRMVVERLTPSERTLTTSDT